MKTYLGHMFFYGKEDFLSNFFDCTSYIWDSFKTSEQAFMWYKACYFNDYDTATKIKNAVTPGEAKALGRQVKNFDPVVWDMISIIKMAEAIDWKFDNSQLLSDMLVDTGDLYLIEASPTDRLWGVGYDDVEICRQLDNYSVHDLQTNFWGQNRLGKLLMAKRWELQNG